MRLCLEQELRAVHLPRLSSTCSRYRKIVGKVRNPEPADRNIVFKGQHNHVYQAALSTRKLLAEVIKLIFSQHFLI